uniref:Uncharacterized protein n=1 Tax=Anguilla anguilla TaxID=7936 RepID=A0A0E9VVF9_ANGAN
MRAVAEEVEAKLVAHAVVTLIVGKLHKGDHLLDGGKRPSFSPHHFGISDGFAYTS